MLQRFVAFQSRLGRLNGADKRVEVSEGLRHVSQKRTRVRGETNFEQGLRRRSSAVEMQELETLLKIGVDRSLISSGALKIGGPALRIGLYERPFRLLHHADQRFEFGARISFELVEHFRRQRRALEIAPVFFAAHDRGEFFL